METDPQAFKRKYEKLLEIHKKYKLYNLIGGIIGLFMVGSLLVITSDKINTGLTLEIKIVLFMVFPIGISVFFLNRSNKYILTSTQRMFFLFYETEVALEAFKDLQTTQTKQNAKKAIIALAFYISGWIARGAPSSLNTIPISISKNLREKMLPIIEHGVSAEISSYRNMLFNFILRISDREPTVDDLTYFDDHLKSIVVKIPVSVTLTARYSILGIEKTSGIFSRNPKLKLVPIAVIAYVASWVYFQNTQSQEFITSFVNNSAVGFGIITVLSIIFAYAWRQQQNIPASKNTDSKQPSP